MRRLSRALHLVVLLVGCGVLVAGCDGNSATGCSLAGNWDTPGGGTIVFASDGTWESGGLSGAWKQNGGSVTVSDGSTACQGAQGTYSLSFSNACNSVAWTTSSDPCAGRAQGFNKVVLTRQSPGSPADLSTGPPSDLSTGTAACAPNTACGSFPVLRPESQPGVYCPFSGTPPITCAAGLECCEPPTGSASTCIAQGASCPAPAVSWECMEDLDCRGNANGSTCCLAGSLCFDSGCGFHRVTNMKATICAHSCQTGQLHVCESAGECTVPGDTCVVTKVLGAQLGVCAAP